MTKDEALKMAIEALEHAELVFYITKDDGSKVSIYAETINACKEALKPHPDCDEACMYQCEHERKHKALEQPAQEPLGWLPATYKYNLMSNDDEYPISMVYHSKRDEDDVAVYTHPAQPCEECESLKKKLAEANDELAFRSSLELHHE